MYVTEIRWEKRGELLFCKQIYENGESLLILVEGDTVAFIKKLSLLQDDITQDDLNKGLAKAFPDYPEKVNKK